MHKVITFHGDPGGVRALADQMKSIEGVIALDHQAGSSLKPAGDVLQVQVLNQDADEVLRLARPFFDHSSGALAIGISQSTALLDDGHRRQIEHDADEILWEEMEADLRNHGRISVNYLLLMGLGGLICAAAFRTAEPVSQGIAFVGASIIAPGFEPIAKATQAFVLHNMRLCKRALLSVVIGYAVVFACAALGFWLLSWSDLARAHATLLHQPVVEAMTEVKLAGLTISACAAVAGVIMIVSLRDLYVVGPLIALTMVPAVALAAAAVVVGERRLAWMAARQVIINMGLVAVLGGMVFYWKQRRFHRRRPMS
jgi:hypothetical protein